MIERKILVVDDSPTDRAIASQACIDKGYNVFTAVDGEEAIEKAKDLQPDLILLDVILPNKNGFQVCRLLKKMDETSRSKVILVTSKSQESDKFWGMKQGADAYLSKPFSDDELHNIIESTMQG